MFTKKNYNLSVKIGVIINPINVAEIIVMIIVPYSWNDKPIKNLTKIINREVIIKISQYLKLISVFSILVIGNVGSRP